MLTGRQNRVLAGICFWLIWPVIGWAQSARIIGRITDPTGAAVPGAQVVVSNEGTGLLRSSTTGVTGYFAIPLLPSGSYRLTILTEGFRPISQSGISLSVDESAQLNYTVAVETARETIQVPSEAAYVETQTGELKDIVDTRRINELPLNGRNPVELQYLIAGVGQRTGVGQAQNRGVAINGARPNTNNYTLDGGDNHDPYFNTPAVFPSPDALQEFSIRVSAYSADGGRNSGVQMNAVTKSGSNGFHGALFEYLRNEKLNARNFFANEVPPFRRHQFGGTLGGPIKRNQTFFFVSYQGTITNSSPTTRSATVPSENQRQGDFSGLSKRLTDPAGGFFPGNQIPESRLHPSSRAFLEAFVPLPNRPEGLSTFASEETLRENQFIARVDHTLGQGNRLTGRLMYNKRDRREATGNVPGFLAAIDYSNWNLVLSDTHVLSSTALNHFTFSLTEIDRDQLSVVPGNLSWSDLGAGFSRAFDSDAPVAHDTRVDGYFRAFSRFPLNHFRSNVQISDSVTFSIGSHLLNVGGDIRISRLDLTELFRVDPQLRFRDRFTGDAAADLLLGRPQSASQIGLTANRPRSKEFAFHLQDDWKIAPRLTLNLGLRWEPYLPFVDVDDRFAQLRLGGRSALFPTAPKGLLFAGDSGVSRATIPSRRSNFAPRFGFALDPFGTGRASIRGGYGVFYSQVRQQAHNQISTNQPFSLKLIIDEPSGGLDDPYSETGNPFPFNPPATDAERQSFEFLEPVAVFQWDAQFRNAIVQNWNLSVQRQFWRNQLLTVAYVGSKGNHLFLMRQMNPGAYRASGETLDERRPLYPRFGSVQSQTSEGNSTYHAVQATFQRRFDRGVGVLASYTFSKLLDDGSSDVDTPGNPFDIANEKGHSDLDISHRFVASFVWDLPRLARKPAFLRPLLGNWATSGILTLETGRWLTIASGSDNSGTGVNQDRADLVGNAHLSKQRPRGEQIEEFFNTAAFAPNPAGSFGTSGRNIIQGPGLAEISLGLNKRIPIRESRRLEFRAEFFNPLNRVNLGNPNRNQSSANFGRITSAGTPRVAQLALRFVF